MASQVVLVRDRPANINGWHCRWPTMSACRVFSR